MAVAGDIDIFTLQPDRIHGMITQNTSVDGIIARGQHLSRAHTTIRNPESIVNQIVDEHSFVINPAL
jgi:hypothetical protein